MVQLHKEMVESMVLIDPVCCWTINPALLKNFIYKLPQFQGTFNILKLVDGATAQLRMSHARHGRPGTQLAAPVGIQRRAEPSGTASLQGVACMAAQQTSERA